MRALLGLLILGSLFVMAASWQKRMTAELRDDRALRYGIPSDSVSGPDGWSRLVLGRPSGADPLPIPEEFRGDAATRVLADGRRTGGLRTDGSSLWEEGGSGDGPEHGHGYAPGAGPRQEADGGRPSPKPAIAQPFGYIVRDGDSLGEICQKHYQLRPLSQVVDAVAQYNGLPSPNAIRAGRTLDLPDPVVLFPELGD